MKTLSIIYVMLAVCEIPLMHSVTCNSDSLFALENNN
jgi:hypothetical protein